MRGRWAAERSGTSYFRGVERSNALDEDADGVGILEDESLLEGAAEAVGGMVAVTLRDAPGDDRFEDDLVGDPGFPPPPPELMLGI